MTSYIAGALAVAVIWFLADALEVLPHQRREAEERQRQLDADLDEIKRRTGSR